MNEARNSPYPSDLTDAEWAVLDPFMPPPATTGRPLKWTRRQMVEAIFYLLRSGVVEIGTITLQTLTSGPKATEQPLFFTPLNLVSGIASSDDPLLVARTRAYRISFD